MTDQINNEWGVIQALKVEADTFQALRGACMVATVRHPHASYFVVQQDEDGGNAVSLRWTGADGATPLPFKLSGPEEIADFLRGWLEKAAIYPSRKPDTDGDVKRGFRVELRDFYDVLTVKPIYTVYGK